MLDAFIIENKEGNLRLSFRSWRLVWIRDLRQNWGSLEINLWLRSMVGLKNIQEYAMLILSFNWEDKACLWNWSLKKARSNTENSDWAISQVYRKLCLVAVCLEKKRPRVTTKLPHHRSNKTLNSTIVLKRWKTRLLLNRNVAWTPKSSFLFHFTYTLVC